MLLTVTHVQKSVPLVDLKARQQCWLLLALCAAFANVDEGEEKCGCHGDYFLYLRKSRIFYFTLGPLAVARQK